MDYPANILAAGDDFGGTLRAIMVVVFMVIIGGAQVLQKLTKEKKRREQLEREAHGGLQSPAQATGAGRQTSDSDQEAVTARREPMEQPAYGRLDQQQPPALPQRRAVRRDLRQPRVADPLPVIVTEPQDEEVHQVVEEELRRQQQRLAREQAERQHRLAELKSQVGQRESVVTIRPHVPHAESAEWRTSEDAASRITVDLADPQAARRAIIFHEILSPPKALRREAEIWDT